MTNPAQPPPYEQQPPPYGQQPPQAQQGGVPSWWRVVALVLAVAVLGLGALAATAMTRGQQDPLGQTAAGSARAACDLIGQVPGSFDLSDDAGEIHTWRLGAAVSLASLAAEQDAKYTDLVEPLRKPSNVMARQYSASTPEFEDAVVDAKAACSARD